MKITISKLLDVSTLDPDTATKIAPLVTQVNTTTEQFARCLRGEITLGDNIKSVLKEVSIPHNVATAINLNTTGDIEGVVLIKSNKMITGFFWELGSEKGAVNITLTTSTSTAAEIKILAFLK